MALRSAWAVRHPGLLVGVTALAFAALLRIFISIASAVAVTATIGFATVGLSVGIVTGLGGQLNLGQIALAEIGPSPPRPGGARPGQARLATLQQDWLSGLYCPAVAEIAVIHREAILAAVAIHEAVERVREAFVEYHRGSWRMPPKVYLASAPYGDFRAMPAGNDEIAILKWVTSFPGNVGSGFPTVTGVLCVNDARTGIPMLLLEASSVTSLRTGAVAAVAAQALAAPGARTVGMVGCGANGSSAARCLAAVGYGPGVCFDPVERAALALAGELGEGWRVGSLDEAMACDVVTCVTPGREPIVTAERLRPGQHLNLLGADGPGKAEATLEAISQIAAQPGGLFCDEWSQASHAGELTAAVQAKLVRREDVGQLGAVLAGDTPGRTSAEAVTLFDSTGLAIQDLAIARVVLARWREGAVEAHTVRL